MCERGLETAQGLLVIIDGGKGLRAAVRQAFVAAAALLGIDPRLRRVKRYRHVPKLREALQRELKIKRAVPTKVAQHQRGSHSELQLILGLIHARQFEYMVQEPAT